MIIIEKPTQFDIVTGQYGLVFTHNLIDAKLVRKVSESSATSVNMAILVDGKEVCQETPLYYDAVGAINIKTKQIAQNIVQYTEPSSEIDFEEIGFTELTLQLKDEKYRSDYIHALLVQGGVTASFANASWWRENLLTWQPQEVTMPIWQPQWLSFAKSDNNPTIIRFKSRLYTAEGIEKITDIYDLTNNCLLRINVCFEKLWRRICEQNKLTPIAYDVYGVGMNNIADAESTWILNSPYTQRYIIRPDSYLDKCFMYQNSLGGFDTIIATGISTLTPQGDVTTFINDGDESELFNDCTSFFEQNTGYITSSRMSRMWMEFFSSQNRYIYNGYFTKIVVDEYEAKQKAAALNAYTFKYHLAKRNETGYFGRETLSAPQLPLKYFKQ